MKRGLSFFLPMAVGGFLLMACSSNPLGGDSNLTRGSSDFSQNFGGPVDRPPFTAESDPVDDLRAKCAAYTDPAVEFPRDEIPEECLGLYDGSHWRIQANNNDQPVQIPLPRVAIPTHPVYEINSLSGHAVANLDLEARELPSDFVPEDKREDLEAFPLDDRLQTVDPEKLFQPPTLPDRNWP